MTLILGRLQMNGAAGGFNNVPIPMTSIFMFDSRMSRNGVVPNVGTTGSAFDLWLAHFTATFGVRAFWGSNTGPFTMPPLGWDDLGGLPCSAPWFLSVGFGPTPSTGGGVNWNNGLSTVTAGRSGSSVTAALNAGTNIGSQGAGPTGAGAQSIFIKVDGSTGSQAWLDNTLIAATPPAGCSAPPTSPPFSASAGAAAEFNRGSAVDVLLPASGVAWKDVVGFAYGRGDASSAQRTAWNDYWHQPGDTYTTAPITLAVTATQGTSGSYTVPGGVSVVQVRMDPGYDGAGGSNAYWGSTFDLNVVAGDTVSYSVGTRSTTTAGGLPDGGSGAGNAVGGTGSSKVWLNGVLIAHQGGQGGRSSGAFTSPGGFNGGLMIDTATRRVTRAGNGGNGTAIGSVSPPGGFATMGGRGATRTAPGAASTVGGGGAGSGSTGGTGATGSTAARSGGGGGGGYFGGGGGGANATADANAVGGGGGGGSSWFNYVAMRNYAQLNISVGAHNPQITLYR